MCRLRTFSVRNPGSTSISAEKLRTSAVAPTSSGSVSASCATTSSAARPGVIARRRRRIAPDAGVGAIFARHACIAGSSPPTRPVSTRTAIENASTGPLTSMLSTRGSAAGAIGTNAAMAARAAAMPAMPPIASTGATSASACSVEPAARRAQRQADGELARPACRPRAEQARQVQAGDEQQARHGGQHHVQASAGRRGSTPRAAAGLRRERRGWSPGNRPRAAGAMVSISRCACCDAAPGLSRATARWS